MNEKIHGMHITDLCFLSQKTIAALKKFKNMDKMTAEEIKTEFFNIQNCFNCMTADEAESFQGEVLLTRQQFLNQRFEELTDTSIL